ncbi:Lipoate-protein ligase LplJ [Moorella humiferrea]|uniref:lipoate--protein ligase n=1 Tax=Neomoorella humiferrea TaxID=676965 RepID=UPI0030CDFA9C
MKKEWRLLDTGLLPAGTNMALDAVLLEAINKRLSRNTLRFLRFLPCVLVGYNQNVYDEIDVEFCRSNGLAINRRLSGGGAILMDPGILGWELVASKDVIDGWGSIEETYRLLCEGCIKALDRLGIKAQFRPHNDIEINGKKISGAGGTELGSAFLFHGTILIDFRLDTMVKALRIPAVKLADKGIHSLRERLTWLSRELAQVPTLDEIKEAVVAGFQEMLGVSFQQEGLSAYEQKELEQKLPWYNSDEWIYGHRKAGWQAMGTSSHKAPGGLIRVDLCLDRQRDIISGLLITGDFFAYPPRLIADLEATLKNCRLNALQKRVQAFFAGREYYLPGVTPDDFILAIKAATVSCLRGEDEK